ncbi:MAG: single-stranded-DNA-specific exonuclease RecJ [Candidatus Latescibacteria bacterium]|nr:single-stranded-DNA-specific exonuclease RecJ [Candidatus Latescibacterota bacterium]
MPKWIETEPGAMGPELVESAGHPLLARLLAQRGLLEPAAVRAFLDPAAYRPADPFDLPDMDRAVETLVQMRDRRICVWGDFDADGQTATALLVEGLQALGWDALYHIPLRRDGHGLNEKDLRQIHSQGAELVLTCDCGTGDHSAIAAAMALGLAVVITDHHELDAEMPPVPVVNPRRLPRDHPRIHASGAGTAHALLEALGQRLDRSEVADSGLDLAALGTVADMVPLLGDNRHLVQRGLGRLFYRPRPGVAQLLRVAGQAAPELADTRPISFGLAPRLNACGRLDQARIGVDLLLAGSAAEGRTLAEKLEQLNAERRRLSAQVEGQAEELAARTRGAEEPVLLLHHPQWHPGVLGVVANRLNQRYGRPVVLMSTPPGEQARGSARSVPGIHIQRLLADQGDLLVRSGGHARAAGFALEEGNLEAFKQALYRAIEALGQEAQEDVAVEAYVPLEQLDVGLVRRLYQLAPFGEGNRPPVLASRAVALVNVAPRGRHDARLVVEGGNGAKLPAVWRGQKAAAVPAGPVDAAFTARLVDVKGRPWVELELVAARPVEKASVGQPAPLSFAVEDWRHHPKRDEALAALQAAEPAVQVWCEGVDRQRLPEGRGRHQLTAGGQLVLWTVPPGPGELQRVLEQVGPERVYLATRSPAAVAPGDFLRLVIGLVKGRLGRGPVSLVELAVRTGQRTSAVLEGLDCLRAMGRLTYQLKGGRVLLEQGRGQRAAARPDKLAHLLRETAAYGRFFQQATPEQLLAGD